VRRPSRDPVVAPPDALAVGEAGALGVEVPEVVPPALPALPEPPPVVGDGEELAAFGAAALGGAEPSTSSHENATEPPSGTFSESTPSEE
jgi:hypothetical protein